MYRVSQLRLSCGPSSDEPHYRRVDELQDHVRKTGTHLMPCIPRYQGHKESCWKLAIDPGLPEGHLQDGTCTYCATVRPAWNKKLADVLGKIEMILDECWGAMQDDFRDPERQCYDDPAAGERRAAEMCASALQAMMLWREEQFYAASEVGGDLFDAGLPSRLSSSPASDEFEQHFQDNHGPTQDRRTEYTSSSSNSMGEPDTTDRSGMVPEEQPYTEAPALSMLIDASKNIETAAKAGTSPRRAAHNHSPAGRHIQTHKHPHKNKVTKSLSKGFNRQPKPWGLADSRVNHFSRLGYELLLHERQ